MNDREKRVAGRLAIHRWILWGGWLGFIPCAMLLDRSFGPSAMLAYGVAWMINNVALGLTTCPRSRNRMFLKFGFGNPFSLKCLHCGWP